MHILPLNNSNAIQINPNLGIILVSDMQGWFYERYVNLFMIGTTIDYIDNVNYSGALLYKHGYSNTDVLSIGVIKIIKHEIDNNNYLHVWVDEQYIPHSIRYNKSHFVHPLMVYGYDETEQILKAVFFDKRKGQVLVDISYQDMICATSNLESYYHLGGLDDTINATITSYGLSPYIKSTFHIEVFAQQLSNYICCETEAGWEWFTSCRAGVFDSNEKIFGIQIYLQLIKFLKTPELSLTIAYKTLHDFISHKKYLLERLKYIQQNFSVPPKYLELVEAFSSSYKSLEQIRLLGIKTQYKLGHFPASICLEPDYLKTLTDTLYASYIIETKVLPQIYDIIINLSYRKDCFSLTNIISFSNNYYDDNANYFNYPVSRFNEYISRIDVVRHNAVGIDNSFEYLLVNNEYKYYLHKNSPTSSPIRSIMLPPVKLNSLRLYTKNSDCDYTINVYPLPNQSIVKTSDCIVLNNAWHSFHHVQQLNEKELRFLITDEDPFLIQENIGVDANEFIYLHVKMTTTVKTIYAQVYFSTVENPHISMDKSLFFKIIPDGSSHSYYINMSHNSRWKGFVKAIRFDPAQYHDNYAWSKDRHEICTIEKVEFIKNIPTGFAECMTANSLEDDGSTFSI